MNQKNRSAHKAALASYVTGFVFSLILTIEAYFLVMNHSLKGGVLIAAIVGMAIVQLLIQLVFFLHLSDEPKPRWNLQVLLFATLVLGIVVFGSLWIMNHLNYNMMSPQETKTYIENEELIKADE